MTFLFKCLHLPALPVLPALLPSRTMASGVTATPEGLNLALGHNEIALTKHPNSFAKRQKETDYTD